MSEINDGGPAFPEVVTDTRGEQGDYYQDTHSEGGMSLRDYFAAKAISSLIRTVQKGGKSGPDAGDDDFTWIARRAYMVSDAMLKARQA